MGEVARSAGGGRADRPKGTCPDGPEGLQDGLGLRKLVSMSISEAARHDLYNGLSELLGPERAETLMTQLPRYNPAEVATKADLVELKTDLEADIAGLESSVTIRLDGVDNGLDGISTRLDRLFLIDRCIGRIILCRI